ncbi:MAG: carbohydrate ABC transporter permease [Clostridia bacterium]|jgi:binding-protein-dependent transport system inner membrane component|nr:carbohydrate ABC transporter permease [Clostridia bacterium]
MRKIKKYTAFDYINMIFLTLFGVVTIYPFYYVVIGAFSNGQTYMSGGVFFAVRGFTLDNFKAIIGDSTLWTAFRNSALRTAAGVASGLLFTSLVAYAMGSPHLRCKALYQNLYIFTMFFSGGTIPFYLLIRVLGLYNSFWVYIVPALFSVYNMIVISNFFRGIPDGLREAAEIEGAGEITIWWTIYMPLSKAVLATVGLWLAVNHWNSYMGTMLYTDADSSTITLQYYLKQIINSAASISGDYETVTTKTVAYAAIVIATIPILCVYPAVQKHFTKGVLVGSLKG